jgi:hypothetical protein
MLVPVLPAPVGIAIVVIDFSGCQNYLWNKIQESEFTA